jgi:hypothetical protein
MRYRWKGPAAPGLPLQEPHDLAFFGEAVQGAFGVDEALAVAYLEDATPAGNQAHRLDALRQGLLQLGRQTGGPLVVASRGAVFDAQVERFRHGCPDSSPAVRDADSG